MREADVRDLLETAAAGDAPPSAVDLERAVRDGRRTRTTRRALLAGGAAAGVSAVLGATAVLRSTGRTPDPATTAPPGWAWPPRVYGPHGGPALPQLPERFDLFGQWAVFGWLPFPVAKITSIVQPDSVSLQADGDYTINLRLLRSAEAADELARKGVVTDAPPVAGRTARWISQAGGARETLLWQFAPGGWAEVYAWTSIGGPDMPTAAAQRTMLHHVASDVGVSAARRERLPFRTAAMPAGIPVDRLDLTLTADGHWEARITASTGWSFTMLLTNVPPESRIVPSFYPGIPSTPDAAQVTHEVDGIAVTLVDGNDAERLTANRLDGVTVEVTARGDGLRQLDPDGVLGFYRTIEVLPDLASWTDRPI
jgi:hypothetical protein